MLSLEKVAYLKGLADGLELGNETKQDKLIGAIIGVLEVVAEDLDILAQRSDDLIDEIDAISEDLADVEDILYDAEDFFSDEEFTDECRCHGEHEHGEHECCGGHDGHEHGEHECCGGHDEHEHGEHECCGGQGDHGHEGGECCGGQGDHGHEGGGCCGGQGALYSVTCPNCGNELTVDESIISKGRFNCPKCNSVLEFETSGDGESADVEESCD